MYYGEYSIAQRIFFISASFLVIGMISAPFILDRETLSIVILLVSILLGIVLLLGFVAQAVYTETAILAAEINELIEQNQETIEVITEF